MHAIADRNLAAVAVVVAVVVVVVFACRTDTTYQLIITEIQKTNIVAAAALVHTSSTNFLNQAEPKIHQTKTAFGSTRFPYTNTIIRGGRVTLSGVCVCVWRPQ